jgi:hypothetical protein
VGVGNATNTTISKSTAQSAGTVVVILV